MLFFFCAHAHILVKLDQIRVIKVSTKSGEHARPLCAHKVTWAHTLACMHPMSLHAQAIISAKFGQKRIIKVSMETGKHANPFTVHNLTQEHAQTNISAKFGQIRERKVSMESQDYFPHVWRYSRSFEVAGGPMRRLYAETWKNVVTLMLGPWNLVCSIFAKLLRYVAHFFCSFIHLLNCLLVYFGSKLEETSINMRWWWDLWFCYFY